MVSHTAGISGPHHCSGPQTYPKKQNPTSMCMNRCACFHPRNSSQFARTLPRDQQRWWLRPLERGVNQREVPIRGAIRLSLPESLKRSAPGVGNPRGSCRCRSLPCQSRPGPRCCGFGHRRPSRVWWLLPKASLPGPDSAPALAWR